MAVSTGLILKTGFSPEPRIINLRVTNIMAEDQKTDSVMTPDDVADDKTTDSAETPQAPAEAQGPAPALGPEDLAKAQFQIQKISIKRWIR